MSSPAHPGHVSLLGLVFLMYSVVCGGPVGIESSVAAGGAFATVCGLLLVALAFSAPLALIVAELACMAPSNAGSIAWVRAAVGVHAAASNAACVAFSNLFDLPLYPSLLTAAIAQVVPLTPVADACIRVGVVALAFGVNVVGMEAVSAASTSMTLLLLMPFIALPLVATAYKSEWTWTALTPAATPVDFTSQWGLFMAGLLWNMQGWASAGNIAAEIAQPQRTFPVGLLLAVALVTASYAYSVAFGAALHPALDDWDDGFLVSVAGDVAPWLGRWTTVAAVTGSLSMFVSSLATYSRALQAIAREGMLPIPLLAQDATRFNTPVAALVLLSVTTAALSFVDLSSLLLLDTTANNTSMLFVIAAFVALRWKRPGAKRPFKLPGGDAGVIVSATSCVLMIGFCFYAIGTESWWVPVGTLGGAAGIWGCSALLQHYRVCNACSDRGHGGQVTDVQDDDVLDDASSEYTPLRAAAAAVPGSSSKPPASPYGIALVKERSGQYSVNSAGTK